MRGFALFPLITVARFFVLVGIPVIFVVLQEVFPELGEGSMREPMSEFIAVLRSMASYSGRLADVARVHGAGPWAAFFHITSPLALPAIATSYLLAFALVIEEYGVPAAIGLSIFQVQRCCRCCWLHWH